MYGGVVLLLLVWAPVNAARDPLVATILILLGAAGLHALESIAVRDFPNETQGNLGHLVGRKFGRDGASEHPTASATTTSVSATRYEQLERIAELHKRGVLDDQEYAAEKSAVLGMSH